MSFNRHQLGRLCTLLHHLTWIRDRTTDLILNVNKAETMITALLYREIGLLLLLTELLFLCGLKSFSYSHFLHLRNISKRRHMVSAAELEKIILAFVSSCLDYCNVLLTCPDKSFLPRFWAILKAAARLSTPSSSKPTSLLFYILYIGSLKIHYKILVLTYDALNVSRLPTTQTAARTVWSQAQNELVGEQRRAVCGTKTVERSQLRLADSVLQSRSKPPCLNRLFVETEWNFLLNYLWLFFCVSTGCYLHFHLYFTLMFSTLWLLACAEYFLNKLTYSLRETAYTPSEITWDTCFSTTVRIRVRRNSKINTPKTPTWLLTFPVVGLSGAYSAQGPRDEDDVINAGQIVTEELGVIAVGLFHTCEHMGTWAAEAKNQVHAPVAHSSLVSNHWIKDCN